MIHDATSKNVLPNPQIPVSRLCKLYLFVPSFFFGLFLECAGA